MRRKVAALALVAALAGLSLASTAQARPEPVDEPIPEPVESLTGSERGDTLDVIERLVDNLPELNPVPVDISDLLPWDSCATPPAGLGYLQQGDRPACDDGSPGEPSSGASPSDEISSTLQIADIDPEPGRDLDPRPGADDARTVSSASAPTPAPTTGPWDPMVQLAAMTAAALLLVVPWLLRSKDDDNEVRRRIYEMVVEDPGLTASAIADELDIHLTTAIYHLERLQDDNRIEGLQEGRSTLYFENHRKYGPVEKRVLTTLKKDTASDVLSAVAENPGIHCAELARRMDLSRTSIKWHTDRLADEGLLNKQPNGGTLELEVPDQTEELLEKHRPA